MGFFFVAFMADQELHVTFGGIDAEREGYSDVQYHMPEERMSYSWGDGEGYEGHADIYAKTESQGSQLIQVFVAGDTPWTALSEYRVMDNKVYPLRHADSVGWLLLGVFSFPILMNLLSKPIRRRIKQLMRVPLGMADL